MNRRNSPAGLIPILILCLGCTLLPDFGQAQSDTETLGVTTATDNNQVRDIRVRVKTTKGDIEGVLFATKTPVTVANFCNLAQRKYYDGIVFHRVIPNFMVQVGDPRTKQPEQEYLGGNGGPGYQFNCECRPDLKHDKPGIFSMANAGRNTNGSQIFITHLPTPHLDGMHTVFGRVVKGQEIVNALRKGDKIVRVELLDKPNALFAQQATHVAKWNKILNARQ